MLPLRKKKSIGLKIQLQPGVIYQSSYVKFKNALSSDDVRQKQLCKYRWQELKNKILEIV